MCSGQATNCLQDQMIKMCRTDLHIHININARCRTIYMRVTSGARWGLDGGDWVVHMLHNTNPWMDNTILHLAACVQMAVECVQ